MQRRDDLDPAVRERAHQLGILAAGHVRELVDAGSSAIRARALADVGRHPELVRVRLGDDRAEGRRT